MSLSSAGRIRRLVTQVGRGRSARGANPVLERLEERRLLSVEVFAGGTLLENGDVIAREFGYEQAGQTVRTRQFTVRNDGATDEVTLSGLAVPDGFVIAEGFSAASLAAGESATFTISLDSSSDPGAKIGDLSFIFDDGDGEQQFTFAVDGYVTQAGGPRIVGLFADNHGGVWIDFDEPIDTSFIDSGGIRIYVAGADGIVGSADDVSHGGTLSYDAQRRQARFDPATAANDDYRIEAASHRILSLTGERLDGEFDPFAENGVSGDGIEGGTFHAAVDISELTDTARLDFSIGVIDIELTPDITPITVENFYQYADMGLWDDTFMHRSVPGFIVQGGGFFVRGEDVVEVPKFDPIVNEYQEGVTSNTRGTMAMAKFGNDPDSATNQWYFNLADNSDNLDNQNGGFTTFARVVGGSSFETMDAIAELDVEDLGAVNGALTDLPVLENYDGPPLTNDELVHLRRAGGEATYGAVEFTGLVFDIVGAEAAPPGDAHYMYDFGAVAQGTVVEIPAAVLNASAVTITVTSATFPGGSAFSLDVTNEVGNDGDDWVIGRTGRFNTTLSFDTATIGEFEDSLILIFDDGEGIRSFVVALTGEVTPPATARPNLAPGSDTGVSNADDITSRDNSSPDNALTFRVDDVVAGSTVTLFADELEIGSLIIPEGETTVWIVTDGATDIPDGTVSITTVQTIGGYDSIHSEALEVTIDSAAPVFDPVQNDVAAVDSVYFEDLTTDDESAGRYVVYALMQGPDGVAFSEDTGVILWTPEFSQLGEHDFIVTATDVAGNVTTLNFTVEVRTVAPAAPDLAAGSDTGIANDDNLTRFNNADEDSRLQFLVTDAIAGSLITIYADDIAIGTATVPDAASQVVVETDGVTMLEDGEYQVRATQTVEDVESGPSTPIFVTIDATAPVFEEPAPRDLNASFLHAYELDLTTDNETAAVNVTYIFVVSPDGAVIDEATGVITWTPGQDQLGPNDFTVSAEDDAGNVGMIELVVTVAESPPAAPTLLPAFDTGYSTSDGITQFNNSSETTVLQFRVEAVLEGATVRVYADDVEVGSTVVPEGVTEVIVETDGVTTIPDGDVAFTTTQATDVGETIASEPLAVTIDTTGPVFVDVDPDLPATALFFYRVDFATDDEDASRYIRYAQVDRVPGSNMTSTNGKLNWTPTEDQIGEVTFLIVGEDAAGNTTEYTFDQTVRSPELTGDGLDISSALTNTGKRQFGLKPTLDARFTALLGIPEDGSKFWLRVIDQTTSEVIDSDRSTNEVTAAITFLVEADHLYRLEVESYQESTGEFTVTIRRDADGRPEDATPIVLEGQDRRDGKDVLLGRLGSYLIINRVDQDYISFLSPTANTVDIRLFTADGLRGEVSLLDGAPGADYAVLASTFAGGADEQASLTADIEANITYFIRVNSYGETNTGKFSVSVAVDAEFTADFPIELGTLETSLNTNGTIEPPTDRDWFSFAADHDGPVLFNSEASFTLGLHMTIVDLDDGDRQVAETGFADGVQPFGRFDVQAGHTYRIRVRSLNNTWGDYNFAFAYDEAGNADQAVVLALDEVPVNSELDGRVSIAEDGINARLEEDWYTFVAPVGGGLTTFSLTTPPGLLRAKMTLYTLQPGGSLHETQLVSDKKATGNLVMIEDIGAGITYYLRVDARQETFLGDYTLHVEIDGNSTIASADDLGVITEDATVVIGETVTLLDKDLFAFTTVQASMVLVDLATGGPDARIRILDANTGRRIASTRPKKNKPAQIRFQAVTGGRYILQVEPTRRQIGQYTVNVALDDFGDTVHAGDFTFTQREVNSELDPLIANVQGVIDPALDQDVYTFVAPTGVTTAYFGIETTPTELFADFGVYTRRPDGALRRIVGGRDRGGTGHVDLRTNLIPGAQYFVIAKSIRGRSTGEYTIRAELDYNNTFPTADDIGIITEPVTLTGFILDKGDTDIYRVEADRDGLLHLLLNGGPNLDADVRIYSTADTTQTLLRGRRRPGLPLAMSIAVSEGDQFFIEIRPRGKTSAGPYTLDLDYDPIIP